jgi:hypothetical protein
VVSGRGSGYEPDRSSLFLLLQKGFTVSHKVYGKGSKEDRRLPEPMTFELWGVRDDEEDSHLFTAIWKPDTMLMARMMMAGDDLSADELAKLLRMVGKTLDNADGVKESWAFAELPKPKTAKANYEPKFRGPDGKLYSVAGPEREKFEDFAAGSSRRRWMTLVYDDEFQVDAEILAEVAKDLLEVATARPTGAR